MSSVLSVDAAWRVTGWTVVAGADGKRERVTQHGVLSGTDGVAIQQVVERCAGRVDCAVIERPYLGKNPDTAEKLARAVGRWEQALELAGIPCTTIRANDWQFGMLRGLITPASKREERYDAALRWCKSYFGPNHCLTIDEACAAVLGVWRLSLLVHQRMVGP